MTSDRSPAKHNRITAWLLAETVFLFCAMAIGANLLDRHFEGLWFYLLYPPLLFAQGLWLDRIYIIGHEGAHRKLAPGNKTVNDLMASVVLLPILVPINIYRKIHVFHHGFNRKDHHTSALDVFVSKKPLNGFRIFYYRMLWFLGVFAGGYFLHSLVSVVIFLFLPTKVAVRISPAFKGWKEKDRLLAWTFFLSAIGLQVLVGLLWGSRAWVLTFGFPLLMFSWVWSVLVYIFHYDTTIGDPVRYNVRSLRRHWFFSWLLMNFNEHATHHMHPNVPWYELPERRQPLPESHMGNQKSKTIWAAIIAQFKGPTIVSEHDLETRKN